MALAGGLAFLGSAGLLAQDLENVGGKISNQGVLSLTGTATGLPDSLLGTFRFIGADQQIPGIYYRNLVLGGTGQKLTAPGRIRVADSLRIDSLVTLRVRQGVSLSLMGVLDEQGYLLGSANRSIVLSGPVSSSDFGRIGMTITWRGASPGLTTVTRVSGTPLSGNGNTSIARYYDINSPVGSGFEADLAFQYDPAEVTVHDPSQLELWNSLDGGVTWMRHETIVDTTRFVLRANRVTSFGRWTASDRAHPLGPTTPAGVPYKLMLIQRPVAQAAPSTVLDPLIVAVVDGYGNPVRDIKVSFSIALKPDNALGDTLTSVQDSTTLLGRASATLRLGNRVGDYVLRAAVPNLVGSPLNVTVRASGIDPVSGGIPYLATASGTSQSAEVNTFASADLVAVVTDQLGNPAPGRSVRFRILSAPAEGSGDSITISSATTDSLGRAWTQFRTGRKSGTYVIRGELANSTSQPVDYTIRATPATAAALALVSGSGQVVLVNGQANALIAKVTDVFGNAKPGTSVSFSVTTRPPGASGDSLGTLQTVTDSAGQARTSFRLGSGPGTYEVSAVSGTLAGSPARFTLVAVANVGEPAFLTGSFGSGQRERVLRTLGEPFRIRISDDKGNPVPNVDIAFAITGAPLGATGYAISDTITKTNAAGEASTILRLGTRSGIYSVAASSPRVLAAPVFSATALHDTAFSISALSGNNQSSAIQTALPAPFVLKVTDAYGNPVAGKRVRFIVQETPYLSTGQSLSVEEALTNEQGTASSTLTLGNRFGTYLVRGISEDLRGSPVNFWSSGTIGGASTILASSGDRQRISINTTLPNDLVVQVSDDGGNPVPGIPIRFRVSGFPEGASGHGLSTAEANTDGNGRARTRLTLGDKAGSYLVEASADGLAGSPVLFLNDALPGEPHRIAWAGPDTISGLTASVITDPFSVIVRDIGNNPVAGVKVTYTFESIPSLASGQGLSIESSVTDTSGRTTTLMTTGNRPGFYQLSATSPGLNGSPLQGGVQATISKPHRIEIVSGDRQIAESNSPVRDPIVMRVTDSLGRGLEGVLVRFGVSRYPEGGGAYTFVPQYGYTDQLGEMRTIFTTGNAFGVYDLLAQGMGVADPITFNVVSSQTQVRLISASGDGQSSLLGDALRAPLAVTLVTTSGSAAVGVPVRFSIVSHPEGATGQRLAEVLVNTDSAGVASTDFRIGSVTGEYAVEASSDNVIGSPYRFIVLATLRMPADMVEMQGSGQSGLPGQTLIEPLAVEVVDSSNVPVKDIPVSFTFIQVPPNAINHRLSVSRTNTDDRGRASSVVTLGNTPGTYVVRASSRSLPADSVLFTLRVDERQPPRLTMLGGSDQGGTIGSTLPQRFVVMVNDSAGDPVSGIPVAFSIAHIPAGALGQRLAVTTALTDQRGEASTVLTLGSKVGMYAVQASSELAVGGPYLFNATARTGSPHSLARILGDNLRSSIMTLLPTPLTVAVRDEGENPVAGIRIVFRFSDVPDGTLGADLTTDTLVTDSLGFASTTVKLGTRVGTYSIEAHDVDSLLDPVLFTAIATVGEAATIVSLSGQSFTQPLNTVLPDSFIVAVSDNGGNPLSGVRITFDISETPDGAEGQALSVKDLLTDGSGRAGTVLRLGRKKGVYVVEARAANAQGSPVRFVTQALTGYPHSLAEADQPLVGYGPVNGLATTPARVVVRDIEGNPVPSIQVRFVFSDSADGSIGHALSHPSVLTDSLGIAATSVRLGNLAGTFAVTALSDTLPSVTFTYTAIAISDPNGDFATNIGDMTSMIDHVTGTRLLSSDRLQLADLDSNSVVDLRDIMLLRNGILAGTWDFTSNFGSVVNMEQSLEAGSKTSAVPSTKSSGNPDIYGNIVPSIELTPLGLRFNLNTTVPVKGVQYYIRFKDAIPQTDPDVRFARIEHMNLSAAASGKELRMVLYNLENIPILPDSGTLFRIPIVLSDVSGIDSARVLVSVDTNVVPQTSTDLEQAPDEKYPVTFWLSQNYPNPFNGNTIIRYDVKDVPDRFVLISLDIFDLLGRRVKTLVRGRIPSGRYEAVWDGTDDVGRSVASGVYYYRYIARDYAETKKLILLK